MQLVLNLISFLKGLKTRVTRPDCDACIQCNLQVPMALMAGPPVGTHSRSSTSPGLPPCCCLSLRKRFVYRQKSISCHHPPSPIASLVDWLCSRLSARWQQRNPSRGRSKALASMRQRPAAAGFLVRSGGMMVGIDHIDEVVCEFLEYGAMGGCVGPGRKDKEGLRIIQVEA